MQEEKENKLDKKQQKELVQLVEQGAITPEQIEAFNEMQFMYNPKEVCLRVINDAILAIDSSFISDEDKEEQRKQFYAIRFFLQCIKVAA
jgi:hypothetical protein